MRKVAAALIASSLLVFASVAGAEECRYSAPRNADIDAAGLHSLLLRLGSSDLDIQGVQGLNRIEVRGTACASDQSWLKNLQISTGRSGDQASVDAERYDISTSIFNLFGSSYAYIKLQVRVPAALAVQVHSGSGDVQAKSLASLDFHSGSGDLIADHVQGALELQLGSADARANDVGSVVLNGTGSGDVHVDGVRGDVRADHSGSGDLQFSNVRGSVRVGSTGSGDVTLSDIGRDAEVGSTGSGDVSANGVGGNFTVRSTGSGDIRYHDVKGKVDVPRGDDD
ncbi:MAG TPA: DUF4097 family beta strand repeat-containing protein [Rhodanobacteraceae bacterium]|nr:DUF4097 family beta strand repeat-containing protein [Rhodanobacteraceae bacterium]